jgi:hypothetical protein
VFSEASSLIYGAEPGLTLNGAASGVTCVVFSSSDSERTRGRGEDACGTCRQGLQAECAGKRHILASIAFSWLVWKARCDTVCFLGACVGPSPTWLSCAANSRHWFHVEPDFLSVLKRRLWRVNALAPIVNTADSSLYSVWFWGLPIFFGSGRTWRSVKLETVCEALPSIIHN